MTDTYPILRCGDSLTLIKDLPDNSCHLILSDIPYGIGCDNWDVLHNNTNSAYMGASKAQKKVGDVFRHRGKPLNGWSEADRNISREYYDWCCGWAGEWLRVLKPGATAFVFAGRRMAHRCIAAMEDNGFIFRDMICWEKEMAAHRAQRVSVVYDRRGDKENAEKWEGWKVGKLRPVFEPILWFMKPYKLGGTLADNILENGVGAYNEREWKRIAQHSENIISVKSSKDDHGMHPAQKPVSLLCPLINLVTLEGQVVLDPFMGAGSTGVACAQTGRKFIGFERDKGYYDISRRRILHE